MADKKSLITRGSYDSSPVSRGLFVLFRALDLPLQYALLSSRSLGAPLINALGGTSIQPSGRPFFLLGTNTGLSPQRAILFGMAIGSFVKQSHWVLAISQESFTPTASGSVGVFNAVFNAANSLLFTNVATSVLSYSSFDETQLPLQTVVGLGMYVLGMVLEWGSEMQRLNFKRDPRNKGKVFTGGLFGLARHINYGGYTLWRAGYATAAAGWVWGAIIAGFFTYDFVNRAIPELDDYCGKRVSYFLPFAAVLLIVCFMQYTAEWMQYKKDVPYKLLPFVL